jgi:hypothetical protein
MLTQDDKFESRDESSAPSMGKEPEPESQSEPAVFVEGTLAGWLTLLGGYVSAHLATFGSNLTRRRL